jgi:predicted GIY-YIG superfamily endonuclease
MSTTPVPIAEKALIAAKKVAKNTAKKAVVKAPRAPKSHHYHVYVIELDDRVWNSAKFRRCNPEYHMGKPFVYVGMTGLDPDTRFDKHKAGIQANKFVTDYGVRLLPVLYEKYNPMPYQAAKEMEVELAIALQAKGLGVWQG